MSNHNQTLLYIKVHGSSRTYPPPYLSEKKLIMNRQPKRESVEDWMKVNVNQPGINMEQKYK
jgi:hypothetical protein